MTKYEAMIILTTDLDDPALEAKLEAFRAEVAKFDGKVNSFTRMGRRSFVSPIRKRDSGIYVLAFLTLNPSAVKPLLDRLTGPQQDGSILRMQITVAPKPHRRSSDQAATKEPASALA